MFKRKVLPFVCLAVVFALPAFAQTIVTIAGGGPNDVPALSAAVSAPRKVVADTSGNFYVSVQTSAGSEIGGGRVYRVDKTGQLIIYVGGGSTGVGDGGLAASAELSEPRGMAFDKAGNLFIADFSSNRIRRVDAATQVITTVAGNGSQGFSGDGGQATSAQLLNPIGVALDGSGDLFIADVSSNRIRRVDAATQVITTYVSGIQPLSLAVDATGNVFFGDAAANQILRVDSATHAITAVAGTGARGFSGDGGPATSAEINEPWDVTIDNSGNIFFVDLNNRRIRRVDVATQIITTVAGGGNGGDGGLATSAALIPTGIGFDSAGNLFIADSGNYRIRRVDAGTQVITTVAGNGTESFSGDGGAATSAQIDSPLGAAVDGGGNLFIADSLNNRVRRVDAGTDVITTVAGNGRSCCFAGDGGPATAAELGGPGGVAADSAGNLFIADSGNHRIRRVDAATGVITTVAGNGIAGFSGDGGPATSAEISAPSGLTFDNGGKLFIADTSNNRIRRVDAATGVITTVAGNGSQGFSGDGGPATSASLNLPRGVAADSAGNLFISDTLNGRIRRVDAATQVITTVAGNCLLPTNQTVGCGGFSGDGGAAMSAQLADPGGITVDTAGNLFIADEGNQRVRRVDAATQVISTYAGNGHHDPVSHVGGYTGDGGPATSAELNSPQGVAIDGAGNLFIADSSNDRIREVVVSKQDQTISFAPIPNRTFIPGGSFTISAIASSGLPVTFNVMNGQSCTISGTTVQITGVGSCTATADQGGNSSYNPAPEVTQSFRILYAPAGQPCYNAPGHTILPPINSDNTSIFNQGRTVPAKFRVCDGSGNSVGTLGVVTGFNVIDTFSGTHSMVAFPPTGSPLRFLPYRRAVLAQTNRSRWSLTCAVLCLVTMVIIFIGRRQKPSSTLLLRRSALIALTLVLGVALISCGGSTGASSAMNAPNQISLLNSVSLSTPDTQFRWDPTDQQWIFNLSTKGLAAGSTYVYRIALNDGTTIVFQFGLN